MPVDDDNGAGSEAGFGAVYSEHVDGIYGFLARRVGAGELAEDLTAQTFLEALASHDRYDPERGPIGPWLFGIAANHLRRYYRQEERALRAIAAFAGRASLAEDDEERIDSRVVAEGRRPEIASALLAMNTGERDVLLLYAWTDLSYTGVAGALDIPVGTVRSRLSRARGRLAAVLTDPPPEIGGRR